jgi:hypothetical protein
MLLTIYRRFNSASDPPENSPHSIESINGKSESNKTKTSHSLFQIYKLCHSIFIFAAHAIGICEFSSRERRFSRAKSLSAVIERHQRHRRDTRPQCFMLNLHDVLIALATI